MIRTCGVPVQSRPGDWGALVPWCPKRKVGRVAWQEFCNEPQTCEREVAGDLDMEKFKQAIT